jgi:hypothetical protein
MLNISHSAAAAVAAGAVYKYDLSMPTHKMYELVQLVRQRVSHLPGEHPDHIFQTAARQMLRCCASDALPGHHS